MFKQKGGGSKAFWTMLKKTALFSHDGFPYFMTNIGGIDDDWSGREVHSEEPWSYHEVDSTSENWSTWGSSSNLPTYFWVLYCSSIPAKILEEQFSGSPTQRCHRPCQWRSSRPRSPRCEKDLPRLFGRGGGFWNKQIDKREEHIRSLLRRGLRLWTIRQKLWRRHTKSQFILLASMLRPLVPSLTRRSVLRNRQIIMYIVSTPTLIYCTLKMFVW